MLWGELDWFLFHEISPWVSVWAGIRGIVWSRLYMVWVLWVILGMSLWLIGCSLSKECIVGGGSILAE